MRKAILIERRDGMILFPQGGFGETIEAPSCATCRWAEAHEDISPFPLRCNRISTVDSLDEEYTPPEGALAETDTNDGGYARLFVAPSFGCVQWEGK